MSREKLLPVDLGHLEDKALAIVDSFRKYNESSRSEEYRNYHLKKAESISETLLRDFGYYFDNKIIGGVVAYGLDENKQK
jgi:hypothetical protein